MNYEKSCGAVVFTVVGKEIKYLIIKSKTGVYGFPKGHVEGDETEVQTALREVFEEVGLRVRLIDGFRSEEEYSLPQKKHTVKRVVYFLGEYGGESFTYQKEELAGAESVNYETAMRLLQFDNSKRILTEANDFLQQVFCGAANNAF